MKHKIKKYKGGRSLEKPPEFYAKNVIGNEVSCDNPEFVLATSEHRTQNSRIEYTRLNRI
jgi:hypothetical protein